MKNKISYYNHRTRSGQFYARNEYLKAQAAGRLAFAFFIAFAVISAFFEPIANLLIK